MSKLVHFLIFVWINFQSVSPNNVSVRRIQMLRFYFQRSVVFITGANVQINVPQDPDVSYLILT